MGENEQGGMLRVVVVLGLIAILSFAVIASVVALKGESTKSMTSTTQEATKVANRKDIDFMLTGTNGKLDKMVSHPNKLISSGFFENVASGNDAKNDTSWTVKPYKPGNISSGIHAELYLNGTEIPFIKPTVKGDYIEMGVDYEVTNAAPVTYTQAQSLNLDSQAAVNVPALRIGIRSDEYGWTKSADVTLTGDMKGTLTVRSPKPTTGNVFELYVYVWNTNFDSLKITNLWVTNATH